MCIRDSPNTAYLVYSNNPNQSGGGDHGKTPEDKNVVFTYKVVVNKKDEMCIRDSSIEARDLFNAVLADINRFADMAVNDEKAVRAIERRLTETCLLYTSSENCHSKSLLLLWICYAVEARFRGIRYKSLAAPDTRPQNRL